MDLMARRRAIMGMPSGKDYTVSGNVLSISNALAKNAKSAIVTFLPKQSGSGDPSPNNVRPISGYNDIGAVRYGKNLFNKDGTDTSKGYVAGKYLDYTGGEVVPGSGSFAISEYIPILPNTSYTVSGLPTSNAWSPSICQYDSNHTFISGANYGNSATKTITTGANAAYVRMSIPMGNINSLQLEYGSSATSYEPYISPVTANVHVGGAGKNKLNPATTSLANSTVFGLSATWSADGVLHFSGTWTGATANSVRVLEVDSSVRSLSVKGFSTGHVSLRWQNGEDRIVADFASMTNGSTYDITVWPMVYEGTAPSVYEPYSIFGGTVDLVSGELRVTWGMADMGTLGWQYNTSYNYPFFHTGVPSDNIVTEWNIASIGCSFYKPLVGMTAGSFRNNSRDLCIAPIYGQGTSFRVALQDSSVTSAADLKTKVNGQQLIYQFATPITYHLTPSQLAMLKGNNTVYSNEGSISLTYVGK